MNPMGVISEGDQWGSFSGTYAADESDFMALLLNNASLPSDQLTGDDHSSSLEVPSSFWLGHDHDSYHSSDVANTNFYGFSHGGSSSQQSYYLSDSHPIFVPDINMDLCTNSFLIEGDDFLSQEKSDGNGEESSGNVPSAADNLPKKDSQPKRKSDMPVPESIPEEKRDNPPENSKKRSRSSSGDVSTLISFSSPS
jgi:hypothetical protein